MLLLEATIHSILLRQNILFEIRILWKMLNKYETTIPKHTETNSDYWLLWRFFRKNWNSFNAISSHEILAVF